MPSAIDEAIKPSGRTEVKISALANVVADIAERAIVNLLNLFINNLRILFPLDD